VHGELTRVELVDRLAGGCIGRTLSLDFGEGRESHQLVPPAIVDVQQKSLTGM
jgi:hypothetical protein